MLKYIYEKFFQRFVIEDIADLSQVYIGNGVYQPQHYSCGNCGKPITEESNKENT